MVVWVHGVQGLLHFRIREEVKDMPHAGTYRKVKVTYRVYWDFGTSKYCSLSISKYDGYSNEDIRDYLVREFSREIGVEHLQKIKLITIDGERVNTIIE